MPVTSLYAALCALLLVALSVRVIGQRRRARVGLGSGGNAALERAIRVHANASEYMPIALVLLALLELNQVHVWILHGVGALLFAGRLAHAQGLSSNSGVSPGRFGGMVMTFISIISASVVLLAGFVMRTFA